MAHEAHIRTLEDKRGRITTSPDHPDLRANALADVDGA